MRWGGGWGGVNPKNLKHWVAGQGCWRGRGAHSERLDHVAVLPVCVRRLHAALVRRLHLLHVVLHAAQRRDGALPDLLALALDGNDGSLRQRAQRGPPHSPLRPGPTVVLTCRQATGDISETAGRCKPHTPSPRPGTNVNSVNRKRTVDKWTANPIPTPKPQNPKQT